MRGNFKILTTARLFHRHYLQGGALRPHDINYSQALEAVTIIVEELKKYEKVCIRNYYVEISEERIKIRNV